MCDTVDLLAGIYSGQPMSPRPSLSPTSSQLEVLYPPDVAALSSAWQLLMAQVAARCMHCRLYITCREMKLYQSKCLGRACMTKSQQRAKSRHCMLITQVVALSLHSGFCAP
jgi:hypothetical protein